MAADQGIKLTQMDPYCRWAAHWRPDNLDPSQFPLDFFGFDGDDFFRIAEALQTDSMSAIVTCPKSQVSIDQLIEGYAETCDRAAGLGMRCDLEFIPFWGLQDLETAWTIVRTADRPNSGIVFDFWHYLRGRPDPALLDSIPGEKISTVQIADADAVLMAGRAMLDDNSLYRVEPGRTAATTASQRRAEPLRARNLFSRLRHVFRRRDRPTLPAIPSARLRPSRYTSCLRVRSGLCDHVESAS